MTFDVTNLKDLAPVATAIFGGVGVKVLERLLSKRGEQFRESSKLRDELREQIDDLRKEIDESNDWRKKYWDQVEFNITQKSLHETALSILRSEIDDLKHRVNISHP